MRKYAYLKKPCPCEAPDPAVKIMLCETEDGCYLFGYCRADAQQCAFDRFYDSVANAFADWNDLIDERGWIELEDPLPGCQHDAFLPLRVKGRESGTPEWGSYEILQDGKWVDYRPETH